MLNVKSNIYGFLRGSFLTDESSFKNWRVLIFVVLLLLLMIYSSHSADAKVVQIAELNKKKRELRAEDIDTSTELMRIKLESSIRDKVKSKGLSPAKRPPQKIKVTYNKE